MFSVKVITAVALTSVVHGVPCKALVLSGGSNNGAWEVGVMWGLTNYGDSTDYYWDVVSGISAGAINTAGTAGWRSDEVVEMNQYLSDSWLYQTNADVYTWRDGSLVHSLLFESSFLDDAPALKHMQEIMAVKSDFGRRVSVGAVDANTGEFVEFNQDNTSYFEFAQAGLSSGSIPGVFPPQHFKGHVLIDGGSVWDVNISSAMNQCHAMGAANDEITLDILVCGTIYPPSTTQGNSVQNYQTAQGFKDVYASTNSIIAEMRAYPGTDLRWYFQEQNPCGIASLDFNGEATWCLQQLGRSDAQWALKMGQPRIKQAVAEWSESKELQTKYPYVLDYIKQ